MLYSFIDFGIDSRYLRELNILLLKKHLLLLFFLLKLDLTGLLKLLFFLRFMDVSGLASSVSRKMDEKFIGK